MMVWRQECVYLCKAKEEKRQIERTNEKYSMWGRGDVPRERFWHASFNVKHNAVETFSIHFGSSHF